VPCVSHISANGRSGGTTGNWHGSGSSSRIRGSTYEVYVYNIKRIIMNDTIKLNTLLDGRDVIVTHVEDTLVLNIIDKSEKIDISLILDKENSEKLRKHI
jgi:hypothetical protein